MVGTEAQQPSGVLGPVKRTPKPSKAKAREAGPPMASLCPRGVPSRCLPEQGTATYHLGQRLLAPSRAVG